MVNCCLFCWFVYCFRVFQNTKRVTGHVTVVSFSFLTTKSNNFGIIRRKWNLNENVFLSLLPNNRWSEKSHKIRGVNWTGRGHISLNSTWRHLFDVGVHRQLDSTWNWMMASRWVHPGEDERQQARSSFCEVSAVEHRLKKHPRKPHMGVDESDFWGQLTPASMSSFSQFGVSEGGGMRLRLWTSCLCL